jgi:hypothetical protein
LQVRKRLQRNKSSADKIRRLISDLSEDQVLDESEIKEIEAQLTKKEMKHWLELKAKVDDEDEDSRGILTKEEVHALCDLMELDVAEILRQEEELAAKSKRELMDISPERRETMKVQKQLEEMRLQMQALLSASGATKPAELETSPALNELPTLERP